MNKSIRKLMTILYLIILVMIIGTLIYLGNRIMVLWPEAMSAQPITIKNDFQFPTPLPTVTPTHQPKPRVFQPGPTPDPWKFAKEWKGRGSRHIDWFTAKCEYWKLKWAGDIELLLEQAGKEGQIQVHLCEDRNYIHKGLGRFRLIVKTDDFWRIEMQEAKFPHAMTSIEADGMSIDMPNH